MFNIFFQEYYQQQYDSNGVKFKIRLLEQILIIFQLLDIRMTEKKRQFKLSSPTLDTYIFILPLHQIIRHLLDINASNISNAKIIRICYLIVVDNLMEYTLMQNKFHSMQQTQIYNASLIPFTTEEQVIEHVGMMQKMNGSQFQDQYVQMLDLLEKEIEVEIIKQYCDKQLQWSQAKINNLIQRERVTNINKFLNYRGFNQLQTLKIQNIWGFIHSLNK